MFDAQSLPERFRTGQTFRLEGLRIEPSTGVIEGAGGREQVDPKVMAVLVMLAQFQGTLVTRLELLESVWKSGDIYDDTLTQCVYQLRGHLQTAGGAEKYRDLIKTLPKRGYLLTGEVIGDEAEAEYAKTTRQNSVGLLIGAIILAIFMAGMWWIWQKIEATPTSSSEVQQTFSVPANTIAVLPFLNTSGSHTLDYMSEGISDGLRDRFAAIPGITVLARRSSIHLSASSMDAQQIGLQWGIGRIVEGRLSQNNGSVSLAVELVDTATGFQLWFKNYTRDSNEVMLLEREIVSDLVAQFLPSAQAAAATEEPTLQQMAAHNKMLLARQLEQQLTEQQLVDEPLLGKVIDLYDQALQINPDSAEAHARLGRMLLYQGNVGLAGPHILTALELDSELAESYTALGLYAWAVREKGIGAAFQKAIELNPNDADAMSYLASWNWMQGNTSVARQFYQAALNLDPLALVRYADLGHFLAFHGLREDAQVVLTQLVQLFPTPAGFLAAARITDALGELDEATAWALQAYQSRPDDDSAGQVTELLARLGMDEEAAWYEPDTGMGQLFWERRYAELVELGEELMFEAADSKDVALLLAFGYSAMGRQEEAIATLEDLGLPGTVLAESRRADELHAMNTYIGALQAVGRVDEARELASWQREMNLRMMQLANSHVWASLLSLACTEAVLGNPQAALVFLETMEAEGVYPWLPWLSDWSCFDGLKNDPRYLNVVAANEEHLAQLRAALPETLAKYGLSLKTD